jgi:PST family polysaccharide transporter
MGIAQGTRACIGFLSNVALVRLLSPNDFGVVAMAATVVSLATTIQDLGLQQVTIQRPELSRAQLSALFLTSIGVSFLTAISLALSAPLVASFFQEPRVTVLIQAFAVIVLLSGGQSQLFGMLIRQFQFETIAKIDVLTALVGALAGIFTAWATASYWALYVTPFVSVIVSFGLASRASSFRLTMPSFQGMGKEFFRFGSGVSGFSVVNYFARNADNVLIGKFSGSDQLGYYDRAYRLILVPLEQIRDPLGRIMLPLLSRLRHEPLRYRRTYLECVSLMMMAVQPGLIVVILFAQDAFRLLFGVHWVPAAQIFQWLGVCALHQIMTGTVGWLFLSQGRTGDLFKIGIFNSATAVISFALGLRWGAIGVAIAYMTSDYLIRLPTTIWWTCRTGPIQMSQLIFCALPHVVACCFSVGALLTIARYMPAVSFVRCIELGLFGYLTYGAVIIAFPEKRLSLRSTFNALTELISPGENSRGDNRGTQRIRAGEYQ